MRKGVLLLGVVACVAFGFLLARLPATPTWALWQIKVALDDRDTVRLRELVDLSAVAANALSDFEAPREGDPDERGAPSLGDIAGALLSGGKVLTVFNDPDHPVRISAAELARAWWRMGRRDGQATVPIEIGQREVTLLLGERPDGAWRVVGITPLRALLRVKPKDGRGSHAAQRAGRSVARRLTAGRADG